MTPGQKRIYRDKWDDFGLEFRYGELIDPAVVFPGDGPLHLEIGFGMGENLIFQAKTHPEARILGIEVHKPGIGSALKKIEQEKLGNIRLMRGDARLILSDYLVEPTRFRQISVLFPDPWPDPESAHRRIVQDDLLALFEARLSPGGILHIATDVDVYRDHCLEIVSARKGWEKAGDYDGKRMRGPTRYELKGLEKDHTIHDMVFRWPG